MSSGNRRRLKMGVGRGCEAQHGLLHGLLALPYDYFVALFKECSPFIVACC